MDLDLSSVSYESGRRALQLAIDGGSSTQEIASLVAEEAEDHRKSFSLDPTDRDRNPLSCEHHTALEVAASAGHIDAVGRLLEAGADPNAPVHKLGTSVLQAAASQGQLVVVQTLLESGARPDHCGECSDATPLIAAAKAGHEVVCKALLQGGADVSISRDCSYTVGRGSTSAIQIAGEASNLTLLELFLEPVNHAAREFDEDDLKRAIAEGRQKDSERLLRARSFLRQARWAIEQTLTKSETTDKMPVKQRLLDTGLGAGYVAPPTQANTIAAAASEGHLEDMKELIQTASDQNSLGAETVTEALQSAVDAGHVALIETLLQAGADATEIDLRDAVAEGHLDALTFILQAGARLDTRSILKDSRHELTPLELAASHGHEAVVDLLLPDGADVSACEEFYQSTDGPTALQQAAAGGHLAVAKRLMDAGVDVDGNGRFQDTALQAAVRAGETAIVELLLAAGADVDAVTGSGQRDQTALSIAAAVNNPGLVARLLSTKTPENARRAAPLALYEAVENHHTNIVRQLLQVHPDVNRWQGEEIGPKEERSLLQMAAANGDLDILEMLLSEGADVNLNPSEGWHQTALQSASERGDLAAVKLLLAAGAETNVMGSTAPPLLLAVRGGHIQVYEHLLAAGADIYATAYRGQTLLEAAEDSQNADIQGRVRVALDSRPTPQVDQPLVEGTGPLCETCRVAPLADLFGHGLRIPNRFVLHPSLTALGASVAAGCPMCCFIWKRLGITSVCIPQPSPVRMWTHNSENNMICHVVEPFPSDDPNTKPKFLTTEFPYALSFPGEVSERTMFSRVPITEDTSSPETYRQINRWLDKCKAEHPKCRARFGNRSLPTKLIYLKTPVDSSLTDPTDSSFQPRLVSTSGMDCLECRYIALSYRWPQNFPVEAKATRDNIQEQMHGLNTAKLPQIFNDVFQVAIGMGISYVWIDSLCIVQDDPEDWNRESAQMIQIYRNAEVTVAAAVPPTNPDLGLFRHGDPSDVPSVRLSNLAGPQQNGVGQDLVLMKPQKEAYGESPLISRGWCFQEREISRRIVHYTETQVLWECRTVRASEGLPDRVEVKEDERVWTGRIFDNELDANNIDRAWYRAVEDYSARHLTVFTDKLPALAGLAAAVRDYKPANCRYVAGLWEDSFLVGLQWYSRSPRAGKAALNTRHPEYVAPTWSWASVAGPISYTEAARCYDPGSNAVEYADYALKVLDIHVQTSTSDPFGAVRHAVLTCTAGLVPGVIWGNDSNLGVATADRYVIGMLNLDIPQERYDGDGMTVVFCIYIGVPPRAGLAVLPTGNKENEYRRVGVMDEMVRDEFEHAEIKKITIV